MCVATQYKGVSMPTKKKATVSKKKIKARTAKISPAKKTTSKKATRPSTKSSRLATKGVPRNVQNPFRESSAYATCYLILSKHPKGLHRSKLLEMMSKQTGKDEKHARYDMTVVLSAKDSNTGPRHRSCRDGYWIKKEGDHVQLMLDKE
jgi:hypothetical protein